MWSLARYCLKALAELLDGALPELVLQADFLGALAHRIEVLVMRRVRRPRDGDLVDLHCYFHNLKNLLMIR